MGKSKTDKGRVIDDAFRREALRECGEATHQVDRHAFAPRLLQRRQQSLQDAARSALHQQDGSGLRLSAGEKITHSFEYNVVLA